MHRLINKRFTIFAVAGLLSLLLSLWMSVRNDVINTDAICYLTSAAFVPQGLHAAMTVCAQAKWPFYAVLVYGLSTLTHLSLITSAYLLNACFTVITVLAFMGIVDLINRYSNDKNNNILWLAAVVILLSHECNAVKQYIVRDHGFWAFYLLSLFFLCRFFLAKKWSHAWGFSISLMIATLFRIEGAVFLVLVPFSAFFVIQDSIAARLKNYIQLNSVSILFVLIVSLGMIIYPPQSLGRVGELQFQILHGLSAAVQNFYQIADFMSHHILRYSAKHDARYILFLLLVIWYFFSVVTNLSLVYTVLVFYAWIKRLPTMATKISIAIWAYIIVNILITAVFLAQNMFLSKRYLLALTLLLMIWVPFALFSLIKQWSVRKWPILIVLSGIVFSAMGGIVDFGPSKKYIHDAGDWLAHNIPRDKSIYTNDYQVMYYSTHFGPAIFSKIIEFTDQFNRSTVDVKQFDYLALRVDKKYLGHDTGLLHSITWQPITTFKNKRGDEVRIYQVSH